MGLDMSLGVEFRCLILGVSLVSVCKFGGGLGSDFG